MDLSLLRKIQIVNSIIVDLGFRVSMLTFEIAKGRRLYPGSPSLFFCPAFGVTRPGFGFSRPSLENSKPSVKFFTPSSVKSVRRVVISGVGFENSKPALVKQIGTKTA